MTNEMLPVEAKPLRPAVDLSALPSVTFDSHNLTWWGTVMFMLIEGFTLALVAAAYFYVRQNYVEWPPLRTPDPSLLIATIELVVMLASIPFARLADRAAKRLDKPAARMWLLVCSVFMLAILVLRWFSFWSLNIRWDTNAYGSVAWTVVGFHATLLIVEAGEIWGTTAAMFKRRVPAHYMSDVSDGAFYWYFIMAIWVPLYGIVFLLPYAL